MCSSTSHHYHYLAMWVLLSACQLSLALAAPISSTSSAPTMPFASVSSTQAPLLQASTGIPELPDPQITAPILPFFTTSKCQITSEALTNTGARPEWDPIEKPYVLALFMLGIILVGVIVACRTCKGCSPQIHPGDAYLRYTVRAPVVQAPGPNRVGIEATRASDRQGVAAVSVVGTGPGMSMASAFAPSTGRSGESGQLLGQQAPRQF